MDPQNKSKEYTREDLKDAVKDLEKLQKGMEQAAKETMKDADETEEVPINLFLEITKICATVLNSEKINEAFVRIASNPNIGADATKDLVQVISVATTMAAYHSITYYDDLLKKELGTQFDHFAKHINDLRAAYGGVQSAIQIHTTQISELQKSSIVKQFKDSNDI